jgi:4-aminobutyrate aminotransferase-like enzyme
MKRKSAFVPVRESLTSLLGRDYIEAVIASRALLSGDSPAALRRLAAEKIDFYPRAMVARQSALLPRLGQVVCKPLTASAAGAGSLKYHEVTRTALAPLSGYGCFRIGESGRLYLIAKSEHYHALAGHAFPGYGLIERARRLGVANATHNNTRGHMTRLAEEAIVRLANGVPPGGPVAPLIGKRGPGALNRIINLETGSLACEAAIKMMLARFYKVQADSSEPRYGGRTPVFVVLGNEGGGLQANYHGTTILAQALRGMWAGLLGRMEKGGVFRVVAVRPNRLDELKAALEKWDKPPFKVAGFLHELVMMNYGAVRLANAYVKGAYAQCARHDVPVLCDEIQTCLWSPEGFMFREYGVTPDFVSIGKGFPGGEYPASKILFGSGHEAFPQFGALVTNGQEELASLAYLITMTWAAANAGHTRAVGDHLADRLADLAARHAGVVARIEGSRHLQGIHFRDVDQARKAVQHMTGAGIDISAQFYKTEVPPACLLKLPLAAGLDVVDAVVDRLDAALKTI